ncbi:MAG: DUF2752 domain-containing protein [Deltaproteobacteria bacterium]|nr:DUF2752 domain-containing protein [Deltaproteobacteria bacterium]
MSGPRWLFSAWWFREAVVFSLGMVILVTAALADPSATSVSLFGWEVPTLCVFRITTGYSCPGCGLTRSISFLVHGQLWDSVRLHPLGPFIFVAIVGQVPYRLARMVRGPSVQLPWSRPRARRSPPTHTP